MCAKFLHCLCALHLIASWAISSDWIKIRGYFLFFRLTAIQVAHWLIACLTWYHGSHKWRSSKQVDTKGHACSYYSALSILWEELRWCRMEFVSWDSKFQVRLIRATTIPSHQMMMKLGIRQSSPLTCRIPCWISQPAKMIQSVSHCLSMWFLTTSTSRTEGDQDQLSP